MEPLRLAGTSPINRGGVLGVSAFYNSPLVYRGSVRRTRGLELTTSSLIFATLGNSNKLDCSRLIQKLRVSEK